MRLSKSTIEVLKNFSTINQGIIFKPGNVLRTMSVMRNMFARAVIKDDIPQEFAIYDLPEFLSTISLFEDAEIEFAEKHLIIKSPSAGNKIKYFYSNPSVIVAPPDKEMKMKGENIALMITEDHISQIQRASGVMKLKELSFNKEGVTCFNSSCPGNEFHLNTAVQTDLDAPNVVMKVDDLKVIPAEYDVKIVDGKMINFKSTTAGLDVEYFVAITA